MSTHSSVLFAKSTHGCMICMLWSQGILGRPDWETAVKTPFGAIPTGSGNGLAASLGLWDPVTAAYSACKRVTHPIDVASALQPPGNRCVHHQHARKAASVHSSLQSVHHGQGCIKLWCQVLVGIVLTFVINQNRCCCCCQAIKLLCLHALLLFTDRPVYWLSVLFKLHQRWYAYVAPSNQEAVECEHHLTICRTMRCWGKQSMQTQILICQLVLFSSTLMQVLHTIVHGIWFHGKSRYRNWTHEVRYEHILSTGHSTCHTLMLLTTSWLCWKSRAGSLGLLWCCSFLQ